MTNANTPKKTDWHPADIGCALKKRGWSMRRLSVHNNLSPTALEHALRKPYPRAERLIAEAIGVPPDEIWAERYAARAEKAAARQRAALESKPRRSRKGR